jgi:hypothetical protein
MWPVKQGLTKLKLLAKSKMANKELLPRRAIHHLPGGLDRPRLPICVEGAR